MPELIGQLSAALASQYEIERQVGAGGMATVYLARDLKHHRRVAVKVLNPDLGMVLGGDRFLSEIRVTANLQHPNLLPLFDSGEANGLLYYVMPYVEGESLRATLDREKQLPIDAALRIASAVASALHYAHRHGVIHRDLKPENILLHDGQPLVADFGIALAVSNAGGSRITQTGISLGTPHYMSPEQATGDRAIDARSDIYSLGAVLYEMLTGEPPHVGNTSQAIIARVLTEKPRSIRLSRPNVAEEVEEAVDRALEKLPADRFATAQDFAMALGQAPIHTGTRSVAGVGRRNRSDRIRLAGVLGVATVALLLGVLGSWLWTRGDRAAPRSAVRFQLVLPPVQGTIIAQPFNPFAISRDGKQFAYRAGDDRTASRWYVRRIDETVGRLLSGVDSAATAAFSPDGRSIALSVGNEIVKLDVGESTPIRLESGATAAGLAWVEDGIIAGALAGGLRLISPEGGEVKQLTTSDESALEVGHQSPVALDDETVAFTVTSRSAPGQRGLRLNTASIKSGKRRSLDVQGATALGMVDDVLIYHDGSGAILGVPFDPKRGRTTGGRIPLVEGVAHSTNGFTRAVMSPNGSLIYLRGLAGGVERELIAVDMGGRASPLAKVRRPFLAPRYSPDGGRIAVSIQGPSNALEIWVYDLTSETLSPLSRAINGTRPEWSAGGRSVHFSSARDKGRFELWQQGADGSTPAARLQAAGSTGDPVQGILSPDSRYLVYRTGFHITSDDLWYRAMSGDTTSKELSAAKDYTERNPAFSPDGRWIAYASNESGSEQIYVRSFPGPGPRYAVTVDGGNSPVWSRDGRKIYYRAGNRMEEATITTSPRFAARRRVLFEQALVEDAWQRSYDLSPDGKHFLAVRSNTVDEQITAFFVHDWAAEVRARRASQRPANFRVRRPP